MVEYPSAPWDIFALFKPSRLGRKKPERFNCEIHNLAGLDT
jgi:hypothetical protein